MNKYANDDKQVRIGRYIMEYNTAIDNYKFACEALKTWTKENDAYIYKLCSECSDNLYKAVEHFLREAIADFEITDDISSLVKLCQILADDERFKNIELAVFVIKKEPRNNSTHLGRLSELGDYYRVIQNLSKLIKIVANEINIKDVPENLEKLDYNKFWYDVEEFKAENCHYILMCDPINDIRDEWVDKFLSLPWSMIIDFDGKNTQGKVGAGVLKQENAQICSLENVKNQGISEITFRLKKTVYLSMESKVAPRRHKEWKAKDKDNFEFWIEKSKTLDKNRAIVVLAKRLDATAKIFVEKIIDTYGNENVKLIFLEDTFTDEDIEDLDNTYEECCYYNISSLTVSIKDIALHQKEENVIHKSEIEGVKLPGYDGDVVVDDIALLNNMKQYFEIVDLEKGTDVSNIYSEEDFLKGEQISWEALRLRYDELPVESVIYDRFIMELKNSLKTVESKNKMFSVLHKPGFGGTTLSRRIAWDIHDKFPVLILNRYNVSETWGILIAFYETIKKGILVIADENNVSKTEIEELQKEVKNSIFPIAVLSVSRIRYNSSVNQKKNIFINTIEEESCKKLEQRCKKLALQKFTLKEVERRENALAKVSINDKCPLLVGLFYLEELFEGTQEYVKRFINDLNEEIEATKIKDAMMIISMCDFFGQKKVYPVMLSKIINPTNIKRFAVREFMKRVQDLFVFEEGNGTTYVKAKHYLISKEIINQLFARDSRSNNWRDYVAARSKDFIDLTLSVCDRKIDPDLQLLLKDMFIENRDTEYLKGKFSVLIESCSLDEDKESILAYLATKYDKYINNEIDIDSQKYNEYQLLAHFWGHLGRFYSQKGKMNNPSKAEDCCRKALEYSEKTGCYDYIILHIAGDTTSKRIQLILDAIENIDDLKSNMDILVEGISEAQDYFEKSIIYGNEEYGKVGLLTLWTKFLIKLFSFTNTMNIFSVDEIDKLCKKIDCSNKTIWIFDCISNTIDLIEYNDYDEYSDTAQSIIYNLKSDFSSLLKVEKSNVLQELNEYLRRLTLMPIKDSKKISNVKRMIIRNILNKYYDGKGVDYSRFEKTDKKTKKDLEKVMGYLSDNLMQDTRKNNDYVLWFNLVRYSDISLDEAVKMGYAWFAFQQDEKIVDPRPAYYLYVLHYLRALEGFTNSIEEGEKYRKICRKICEEKKGDNFVINYSKVRDWLGNGKGLRALVDDRNIDYSNILKDDNLMKMKGKFIEIDPSNRKVYGYISVTEPVYLRGAKVFFKPLECGVSMQQIGHIFEFKLGFSFERMVAFDKSIRDISSIKNESIQKFDSKIIKKHVSKGELVHIDIYSFQREKKRLRGIIVENGKKAFLAQSEIDYNRYVTTQEMEDYVGSKNVEVKIIDYNAEYDFYYVSIKQIALGTNDNIEMGTMGDLLKNIKLN